MLRSPEHLVLTEILREELVVLSCHHVSVYRPRPADVTLCMEEEATRVSGRGATTPPRTVSQPCHVFGDGTQQPPRRTDDAARSDAHTHDQKTAIEVTSSTRPEHIDGVPAVSRSRKCAFRTCAGPKGHKPRGAQSEALSRSCYV
jgi:hypothetical protein